VKVDPSPSLLETLMSQAASAFVNAQLHHQIARAQAEQTQLLELTSAMSTELQLRPLSLSDRGVLMAVTVRGSVQSDMQIPNGHLVAIGAGQFEGGKLVISLEPHF